MKTCRPPFVPMLLLAVIALGVLCRGQSRTHQVPKIDGAWWQIAGNPDLGPFSTATQQPVDFAIWQALDGTWQLWSCIRNTAVGGASRLFHRWEGRTLQTRHWQPMGVAMQADPALGELQGGLQAPHVVRVGDTFWMAYGDFHRICLARSTDGKVFTRVQNQNGQPDLFTGPYLNSRDAMLFRHGRLWACYYTGSQPGAPHPCAVFCRTSADLVHWSEWTIVSAGGTASVPPHPFDAECPFVVERNGWYYLFRNQLYGQTAHNTQYASKNPFDFGVGTDRCRIGTLPVAAPEVVRHGGQDFLAALNPGLDGIRLARLVWVDP